MLESVPESWAVDRGSMSQLTHQNGVSSDCSPRFRERWSLELGGGVSAVDDVSLRVISRIGAVPELRPFDGYADGRGRWAASCESTGVIHLESPTLNSLERSF